MKQYMYYVNYLSPVNHKFDRELIILKLCFWVYTLLECVLGNAYYYMIFEKDAGLMKVLAQETTADIRFPS